VRSEELWEDHAYAALATGQRRKSLAIFARLESAYVPNATQLSVGAMAYWEDGHKLAGMALVNKAIRLTPGHAMARNFRGWMHLQSGQTAEALSDLQIAVKHAPEYATAWANLAACHLASGDLEGAREAAGQAVKHGWGDLNVLRVQLRLAEAEPDPARSKEISGMIDILTGKAP
jgi:tetratricopeptide (TPR) repeat protein